MKIEILRKNAHVRKWAWPPRVFPKELSLTKLFGGSRDLVKSIHAKKLQVRIFSRLGLLIQDIALTIRAPRQEPR